MLYPFIVGENAMDAGMSDSQWRDFGATLRAVHASGLEERFRDLLPAETFALPSAALVRQLLDVANDGPFVSEIAAAHAAFWRAQRRRSRGC